MAKKKLLSTDEQIDKLTYLTRVADAAATEPDLVKRLGAITIYAGEVDFWAIQAARLVEQVVLKGAVAEGKEPAFQPHDDTYFYDNQIDTRRILHEIKKLLPLRSVDPEGEEAAARVSELAGKFLKAANGFLNYRIAIVHHMTSPKNTLDDVNSLCDKAISASREVRACHREFSEAAAPYRFGPRELEYFYSSR